MKKKLLKYCHKNWRNVIQIFSFFILACQQPENSSGESVENILSSFELDPDFQIELIAKEPLIADPVAMEIDEYGRLYVVEMHGYPLDKSGTGVVKLLTDSNGDGQVDQSTVFADGLMLPTGIMRWKRGILVTDPPNVLYFEDSTGDGKADIREVVLTGFAVSNPQHNVNNPLLGLDNWIYLGHEQAVTAQIYKEEFGDRGSDIHYPAQPDGPRLPDNGRGRSIRFKPDQKLLENIAVNTQFGHTFDQWGRHFLVSNADHIYHEVIAAPYVERNPNLLIADAAQSISDHGNAAEVFPITQNPEHQLLTDVGVFTSACGISFYSGGLFPERFSQMTFVAEPVSNIVHIDEIFDEGATFVAKRVLPDREFLASKDPWFRPVNTYIGPDGALYIIDYYRQYIEHPEWMAEDVAQSGALYKGTDRGRIYRITPKGTAPYSWAKDVKLGDATDQQLVNFLGHKNIWWRRNAQRLLIDRDNKEIVASLEKIAIEGNPMGRLHALYTLDGLNELKPELLKRALNDVEPGIRENAIKLSEQFIESDPEIASALLSLKNDNNEKVRYQLLSSLGYIGTPEAVEAREEILFKDISDPWVQLAALSAANFQEIASLESLIRNFDQHNPSYASLVQRLGAMAGANRSPEKLRPLIHKALKSRDGGAPGWKPALLAGLAEGMKNTNHGFEKLDGEKRMLLDAALNSADQGVSQSGLKLLRVLGLPAGSEAVLNRAAGLALEPSAPAGKRVIAIQLLTLGKGEKYEDIYKSLIVPREQASIQQAAMQALSAIPGTNAGIYIINNWGSLTPEVREVALNSFFADEERIKLLLNALEDKKIEPASIGWRRSVRLMNYSDKSIRDHARALLTQKNIERQEVVRDYQVSLGLEGNSANGEMVYQKNCAMCHQISGKNGLHFGPDLGTIRNRRPENILADILDPNLSIADGHDMWMIELQSGETIQGLIASETPAALTVRAFGGDERIIARKDIHTIKALGMSAMPAGMENQINHQEMADLLAFLKNLK